MSGRFGPIQLSPAEVQLLSSAFGSPEASVRSWTGWRSRHDLEADVSADVYSVFPLISANLDRAGVRDPYSDRLGGVRRKTWYRNQMVIRDGVRATDHLRGARVRFALGGLTALLARHLRDASLFPLDQFKIILTSDGDRAVETLNRAGWITVYVSRTPVGGYTRLVMRSPKGNRLVLSVRRLSREGDSSDAPCQTRPFDQLGFAEREFDVIDPAASMLELAAPPADLYRRSLFLRTAATLPLLASDIDIATSDLIDDARRTYTVAALHEVVVAASGVIDVEHRSNIVEALGGLREPVWERCERRRTQEGRGLSRRFWGAWYRNRRLEPDSSWLGCATSFVARRFPPAEIRRLLTRTAPESRTSQVAL